MLAQVDAQPLIRQPPKSCIRIPNLCGACNLQRVEPPSTGDVVHFHKTSQMYFGTGKPHDWVGYQHLALLEAQRTAARPVPPLGA